MKGSTLTQHKGQSALASLVIIMVIVTYFAILKVSMLIVGLLNLVLLNINRVLWCSESSHNSKCLKFAKKMLSLVLNLKKMIIISVPL
jgi:hypothetical protein